MAGGGHKFPQSLAEKIMAHISSSVPSTHTGIRASPGPRHRGLCVLCLPTGGPGSASAADWRPALDLHRHSRGNAFELPASDRIRVSGSESASVPSPAGVWPAGRPTTARIRSGRSESRRARHWAGSAAGDRRQRFTPPASDRQRGEPLPCVPPGGKGCRAASPADRRPESGRSSGQRARPPRDA